MRHPPSTGPESGPVRFRLADWKQQSLTAFLLFSFCASPHPAAGQEWVYIARKGDSPWLIAKRYTKDAARYAARLQTLNQIKDSGRMQVGTTLRIPLDWLKWTPAPATVLSTSGNCFRTPAASEVRAVLQPQQQLYSGDTLTTDTGANALIAFADGSRLFVRSNSELILDSVSLFGQSGMVDTHIRLQRGGIENQVEPQNPSNSRYRISTPSATATVRGTRFRVAAEPEFTRSEVLSGGVLMGREATDSAPSVNAGFGLKAERNQPLPKPRALLPRPDLSTLPDTFPHPRIQLSWPHLTGAVAYRVQVSSDAHFETLVHDQQVPQADIQIDGLKDGLYSMRLRAIDALGLEGLDAIHSFTLNTHTLVPQPLGKRDGGSLNMRLGKLLFRWTSPKAATSFHFQLAADRHFKHILIERPTLQSPKMLLGTILPGKQYFWRVAAGNAIGQSSLFSPVQSFTITKANPK